MHEKGAYKCGKYKILNKIGQLKSGLCILHNHTNDNDSENLALTQAVTKST